MTDTTNDLLNRYADLKGLKSDRQIAINLGITPSAVYNYRSGLSKMDDATAVQVAEAIHADPLETLARLHLERNPTPRQRSVWEKYRGRVLLALAASTILSVQHNDSHAAEVMLKGFNPVCIMRNWLRCIIRAMMLSGVQRLVHDTNRGLLGESG